MSSTLSIFDRVKINIKDAIALGPLTWARNKRAILEARRNRIKEIKLSSRKARYPMYVRMGTSDLGVFRHVCISEEYGHFKELGDEALIVDCGANVGYASCYLLSRFPSAHVIAVEPDPDNYLLLVRNLAPYGNRAQSIQAAVWPTQATLKMSSAVFRGGGAYARIVQECEEMASREDESDVVEAVTIESLLSSMGYDRIALLKIDIEGAETMLFERNYERWLGRVDRIMIELHKDSFWGNPYDVFFDAIEQYGFQAVHQGELHICSRL